MINIAKNEVGGLAKAQLWGVGYLRVVCPGNPGGGRTVPAGQGRVLSGSRRRCCTFIPGSCSGQWRRSNDFPVQKAIGNRMNVQRGRRCTFIPLPGPRAAPQIRVIPPFYDRGL